VIYIFIYHFIFADRLNYNTTMAKTKKEEKKTEEGDESPTPAAGQLHQ
jgi:hypothetical protein